MLRKRPGQAMQSSARKIHALRSYRAIQDRELQAQASGVRRLNPRLAPGTEKGFQSFMTESLYHRLSV